MAQPHAAKTPDCLVLCVFHATTADSYLDCILYMIALFFDCFRIPYYYKRQELHLHFGELKHYLRCSQVVRRYADHWLSFPNISQSQDLYYLSVTNTYWFSETLYVNQFGGHCFQLFLWLPLPKLYGYI